METTVAERNTFLNRKKLTYLAQFRIDDNRKLVHFTEQLKETSFGFGTSSDDTGPGFGYKVETIKLTGKSREGNIKERSELLKKKYNYTFDFSTIRNKIEKETKKMGYTFSQHITLLGL